MICAALSVAAIGCGGNDSADSAGGDTTSRGGGSDTSQVASSDSTTLNYGSLLDPFTLDPGAAYDNGSWRVVRNVYDTLTYDRIPTQDVEPGVAESWRVNDARDEYTFKIRRGLRFHDGSPLDAAAVKFSYDRTLSMRLGPSTFISDIESTSARDANTFVVKLRDTSPYFLQKTTKIGILNPRVVRQHARGDDQGAAWLRQHVAGSGAYEMVEFVPGEKVVLRSFKDFWRGWDGDHVENVVIRTIPEMSTARQLLSRGEIDMMTNLPVDMIVALGEEDGIRVIEAPMYAINFFPMNMSKPPFDDPKVREAVTLAFPYEEMAQGAYQGYATVPNGPLAEGLEGWNEDLEPYRTDLERAKQLLGEAGQENLSFTINTIQGAVDQQHAGELLQASINSIGGNVRIQPLAWPALDAKFTDPSTAGEMAGLNQAAYSIDPIAYMAQGFHSRNIGGTYNWSYLRDAAIDRALDEAATTLDDGDRIELLKEAQELIRNQYASISTVSPRYVDAIRADVQGYEFNPSDYYYIPRFYDIHKG